MSYCDWRTPTSWLPTAGKKKACRTKKENITVESNTNNSDMDEDSKLNDKGRNPEMQDMPFSWPYLEDHFNGVGSKNNLWQMGCISCTRPGLSD